MRTAIIIFLYALLFFLLLLLATAGCYFSKFTKRRESAKAAVNAADVEANNAVEDKKASHINLPDNFYLDPVVYPTAPRRSSKRVSLEQIVPDHPPSDSSADGSSTAPASKEGGNSDQLSSTSSIPAPVPRRPPPPTQLDDLLSGFPCEAHATRDVWYPCANGMTGRWELGVVRGSAKDAQLLKDIDYRFVREVAENSAGAIEEAVVATPSQASLDEYDTVEILPQVTERRRKSGKSSERRQDKARNIYPHGLDIPELHVNARPYAEIEAEEARAAAMTPADASDA